MSICGNQSRIDWQFIEGDADRYLEPSAAGQHCGDTGHISKSVKGKYIKRMWGISNKQLNGSADC